MNPRCLSILLMMGLLGTSIAEETPASAPERRDFRSKSGKKLTASIAGFDADGKVLLQPSEPRAVPLTSLHADDQAYIKEWQELKEKEAEFIREGWLNYHYTDPAIKILKGNMRLLGKDDQWEPYSPTDITQVKYIGYYFSNEFPEDSFIKQVSDSYRRLKKRSPHIEVVYISYGETNKALKEYIKDKKLEMPILDLTARSQLRSDMVGSLFKRVVPQFVVVDRQGQVKADSHKGKDERADLKGTLDTLEKLAKEAVREAAEK